MWRHTIRLMSLDSFFNHSQSIKLKMTSPMGVPERFAKPARLKNRIHTDFPPEASKHVID